MASHPSGSASDSPADHSSDAPAATSSHLPKRSPPGSPPSPRRQNTVLPPIATIQSEADVDSSRNPPQQPPPRTSSASSQPRQTPQHNYHPPLSSTAPHPPTTTMHPQFNSGMNGSSHHQPYYPSQSPQQQQAMMPPGYNPQTQGSSPRSNVHNTAPQTFSYSQQLPPSQQSHPPQGPPYTTYTQYTQPHLPLPHQFPTSSGSSIPPTPQSGSDSPVSPTGGSNANTAKRKRKSTDGPKTKHEKDSDGDGAQDSPLSGSAAAAAAAAADKHKRTKTQRACDPCRRKKIRCVSSSPSWCRLLAYRTILDVILCRIQSHKYVNIADNMASNAHSSSQSQKPDSKRGKWNKIWLRPKRNRLGRPKASRGTEAVVVQAILIGK
jgi:hypothetical protein